jgi:hypothetical protein
MAKSALVAKRSPRAAAKREHEQQADECAGECSGVGIGIDITDGECPKDCAGHVFSEAAIRRAKINARADANSKCQNTGGPDCLCTGGKYVKKNEGCETERLQGPHGEVVKCKWWIRYRYKGGECKIVD